MIRDFGISLFISLLSYWFFSSSVLVTGGAGFIGFHTSLKLANEGGVKVIVLDSFNDYYDVNLKKSRTAVLKDKGYCVYSSQLIILWMIIMRAR